MIKSFRRTQIMACILAFILFFMNCYVPEAFAANRNNGNSGKGAEREQRIKTGKSDRRTDIIVKYKDDSKRDKIVKNAKSRTRSGKFNQKNYLKKQKIGVYEINSSDDMTSVLQELNADPSVEYAQPNYPLEITAVPTDNNFEDQWYLYNDGQEVDGYVGRSTVDINAINAWDLTLIENDVVIGVLDTGLDYQHMDLAANIYTNPDEIKNNGIDDDGNGYIDDTNGWDFFNDDSSIYDSSIKDAHGTYITGIIAAEKDNGGIVGVAPNIKIMPLKFINGGSGYTSDAIEAIDYAKNMGIKIINCSFGGTDNNQALKDAMENSGILFICSAGNQGKNTLEKPVYPAAFDIDNVLSVTSIDSKGLLPNFASYGNNVDVAAPGTSIKSTAPSNGYSYFSGTSISTAVVSGIAALIKINNPDSQIITIKNRILDNVTSCASLEGKVATGGRVDAYGSLTGMIRAKDTYIGKSDANDIPPIEGDGDVDTWYIMNELASNVERFHYGEGGVNPATGNYSFTCTDLSVTAPGFKVEISRTYNSRNLKQTLLGRGWTFGFEGKLINKGDSVEICLPNGSSHVFNLVNNKYVGEGTRSTFVRNVNGVDILTTQDQYKYGFNTGTNQMEYMEDKNGNKIDLIYNDINKKLVEIVDTVGRSYQLTYNDKDLLSSVTDPAERVVTYTYNADNLLTKVTDPERETLTYEYDASQFLTKHKDQRGQVFQQLEYFHDLGSYENKVVKSTDAAGETWSYSYDIDNGNTTITNNSGRKWTYWYDMFMNTTRVQDPEGQSTYTVYDYHDTLNYYGDIIARIDRNGNRTDYVVDEITGNATKITKPDGGIKSYVYDQWNNVIEEEDENGNKTFYFYDAEGKNLLNKVQALNGDDTYIAGNTPQYAVTTYSYYSGSEAKGAFNCDASGLLKSVTDAEGNSTEYTYNVYGDVETIKDAVENVTTYTYDVVGQKTTQITAEGNKTQWSFNDNGQVIREIHQDRGVQRYVYDQTGKLVLEVSPNLYVSSKDNTSTDIYTGTEGIKYEWYDNGYQKAVTDEKGHRTEYEWDNYGNKKKETKPSGAVYHYEYDDLNRLTKTSVQKSANTSKEIVSEISYGLIVDGNTQTTTNVYSDDTQKSSVVSIKDYAGREVEVQYGEYGRTSTSYNLDGTVHQTTAANGAITYYNYDVMGNMSDIWKPVAISDGKSMFSWTGYTYDKAGHVITEKRGKPLVQKDLKTDDVYTQDYKYVKGQLQTQKDTDGKSTSYAYNGEGRIKTQTQKVSASSDQVTDYEYNYRGQITSSTLEARVGDLSGYDYNDNGKKELVTAYEYDLNGNLVKQTDAANHEVKYEYDKLNRNTEIKKYLKNVEGATSEVVTSQTYNWDGQKLSYTDAKGNTTYYEYDSRGNQTKIVEAQVKTTLKEYDRLGRNTAIVSANNYKPNATIDTMDRTVFTYDALGRVFQQKEIYHKKTPISATDWSEELVEITTKEYKYDMLGNVTESKNALGDINYTSYNLAGLAEYVTDAETRARELSYTVMYTYNGLLQKSGETYQGAEYHYTYDGSGNLLRTEINGTVKATSAYDSLGREIRITDALGNTKTQSWNTLGRIAKTTTPGDATIGSLQTTYQYDPTGNLVKSRDSMGVITSYTYDSLGRNFSKTVQNAVGNEILSTYTDYDLNNNVVSQKDGNGNITAYEYDSLNRLKDSTNARNQKTTYTYDANGNKLTTEDYLGNVTKNVYDGINRLVETRDAYDKVVQQILYNNADAQISSYDALHHETKYLYDKNLRQTGTIDAEGGTSSLAYDTRGNVSTKTDGNRNTTLYRYDAENRLISVMDPRSNTTRYSYDANGNLIAQMDGNGNTTTYQYNAANLVRVKTEPSDEKKNGKSESYTYTAKGLLATKTDRNGLTTIYTYDTFGRRLSEDAGGEVQSYTYDDNGNMLTMTDDTGTTTRTYDALNRNESKEVPVIGLSTYEYDLPVENPREYAERTTDPKGNVTLKTYDKVGRLSKVTLGSDETTYEYYSNGRQWIVTYPDGTTETYAYDMVNRITELVNRKANNILSSYHYDYDDAGNQTEKREEKGTTIYTYDTLNRLDTVEEPDGKKTSYTYDGAGNRKSEQVEKGLISSTTVYYYSAQNRLTATLSSNGAKTIYLYDSNGNLLSKSTSMMKSISANELTKENIPNFDLIIRRDTTKGTGSDSFTTYAYDNYNRLTGTKSANTTSNYAYNAQGYRTEKKVNNKTTRYLYESDKVVLETDENNNQTAFQVYGAALIYRSTSADSELGAQNYYYLYNAHGDVTALMNSAGNIAVSYDYDAFGNIISQTGAADNAIKYAGYQHDEESGLYYLNARYYDSVTARFISEDTYTGQRNDPLSLNLYSYCSNNPIKYYDPTGHMNYLTQTDNLLKGVKDGVGDSVTGILKSPKAIYDLANSLMSGEISAKDLAKAGLSGLVDDYLYVAKNSNVLNPAKKTSNVKVEEYGEHLGAIITDLGMALTGAGAAKVIKVLSKTKAGAQIVKALDEVEDVTSAAEKAEDAANATKKAEEAAKVAKKAEGAAQGSGKSGLYQSKIDDILSKERGTRPDPSTYLSKDYINNHLAQFDEGVTRITSSVPSGVVGPPGGTFVMPKSIADDLIKQSGGDIAKLEKSLGLEQGALGSNPVRVDIASPEGLRMPSGNEFGANSQWIPGGYTNGGIPEATINPATPGTYTVTKIK